jgi:hypothetical protein
MIFCLQEGLKVCSIIEEFGKYNSCLLEVGQPTWNLHQGAGQSHRCLI